jgi:TldD protein
VLKPELLEDIIKRALARGGEYAEVFEEYSLPAYLQFEGGKLEKASTGTIQGAGIRLIYNKKTYYAHSNDLTPANLLEAAATLAHAAAAARDEGPVTLSLEVRHPSVEHRFERPPDGVSMEEKAAILRRADAAARGMGSAIVQVNAIYKDTVQEIQVAASDGTLARDLRILTTGMVSVVARKDGEIQTGYEPVGGLAGFEVLAGDSLERAARQAADRALRMLAARRAPGGRMPVIVSSEAGGTMIHEAIGHGLEADLAGQGISRFSGRVGQQVASALVTVVDDATLPGRRGSFAFDDEGTPAQRTVLVEGGVLRGYMSDRLSALRFGFPLSGNGRRESYRRRPIPRMTNTLIVPGIDDPDEILRSTPKGLFVRAMGGGEVNTVTGDFVFDVKEGYLIQNGALGDLVRGATLTGNGPEVLLAIDRVGSDLGFSIGTCGKDSQGVPIADAMPTVRIPEMVVGGEVGA